MSEHQFAKLFERDGRQLLVTKDSDDEDGNPQIRFQTTTESGHRASLNFTYGEDDWDKRDAMFDQLTEEDCWNKIPSPAILAL